MARATVSEVLRRSAALLPAAPGVYRFLDAQRRVAYLGRAGDLRARVRSYTGDLADRPHLRRMVPQVAAVEALACASAHEAAWLERNLLERSLPRWNRVRGGLELPAWLVLDDGSARPDLRVVVGERPGGEAYGPYLGVERLAAARGGVLRAWPLPLSGDRLDVAGRSLAEARGVAPSDRAGYVAAIRAVLAREPAAVGALGARLEEAGAAAVERLAFETAAQVRDERAAVGWLVAPQRVTGCARGLVVGAWADGTGFVLRATSDRLDRWATGPVEEAAAREAAGRTPEEWRDFAVLNAGLAARLAAVAR